MAAIPISAIRIGRRLRSLREASVAALAESIATIGLQHPISVRSAGFLEEGKASFEDGYQLLAGHHRLEACRRLGLIEIEAAIVTLGEAERQIWEIDENLCRADLTELERGEHLLKRKEVYAWWRPSRTPNGQFGAAEERSFITETSESTRIPERTIHRSIQRTKRIDEQLRPAVAELPDVANSGIELDALGRLEPEDQKRVITAISDGRAKTVREAVGAIIKAPSVRPMFKNKFKLSQKWRASFMRLIAKAEPEDLEWAREQLDMPVADRCAPLTVVK